MMKKMEFYVIKLSKDKNVYLKAIEKGFKWDKKEEAIFWQTWRDAEKFAQGYFKNYNNWTIEEVLVEL